MNPETRLVRIQTDPATGRAQAYFETTLTTAEGVAYRQPWQEISWLIASGLPVPITLADGTAAATTRAAIFAAVQAIANEERLSPTTTVQ